MAEQIDEWLQFIAECFAKKVDYGNNYDYTMSAFYADKILNKFEEGTINALVYPSVADKLDFSNVAIKPTVLDEHFELYQIDEGILVGVPILPVVGSLLVELAGAERSMMKKSVRNDLLNSNFKLQNRIIKHRKISLLT